MTPRTAARQAPLSSTISRSVRKLKSMEPVLPSNHLILCHPLLLLPSSFPVSGSFPMIRLCTSGGQSIGASVLASVLPVSVQNWCSLGLTGLISLLHETLTKELELISGKLAMEARESRHLRIGVEGLSLKTSFSPSLLSSARRLSSTRLRLCHVMTPLCCCFISKEVRTSRLI